MKQTWWNINKQSRVLLVCVSLLAPVTVEASPLQESRPSLVVFISLDQFPQEYLTRFGSYFHDGFVLLQSKGASFRNARYRQAQCATGPGHAVLLTGADAASNGIIANNWYDRRTQSRQYCVEDRSTSLLGADGVGCSPRFLMAPTYGDMLRISSGFHAKVVSISNKDRAAVLMGGRIPTGAFWMVDSAFVTSSYYMKSTPLWVDNFNRSGAINSFFGRSWTKSLPDSCFERLDRDNAPYEDNHDDLGITFPHPITGLDHRRITSSYYSALVTSPYGAELLEQFAEAAVLGEELGRRSEMDLLCVSFSSTDYVGHTFGPHSHEVLEMAVAMDRILGKFLRFLDEKVGLDRCLIVLSSDHGITPIPEYILSRNANALAGRTSVEATRASCEAGMIERFGRPPAEMSWIEAVSDHNVYIRHGLLASRHIPLQDACSVVAAKLVSLPPFAQAYSVESDATMNNSELFAKVLRNVYHGRSGDVVYIIQPFYLDEGIAGTAHSDPYDYNSHVPIIFMGKGIAAGVHSEEASPEDIAPTLSNLTGIEFPASRTGAILRGLQSSASSTSFFTGSTR